MTLYQKLSGMSDAQLVQEYWNGTETAFEVLVERHNASLKRYMHVLMHNAVLEEAALQICGYMCRGN